MTECSRTFAQALVEVVHQQAIGLLVGREFGASLDRVDEPLCQAPNGNWARPVLIMSAHAMVMRGAAWQAVDLSGCASPRTAARASFFPRMLTSSLDMSWPATDNPHGSLVKCFHCEAYQGHGRYTRYAKLVAWRTGPFGWLSLELPQPMHPAQQ